MGSNKNGNEYKEKELFKAQAQLYKTIYSFLNPMSLKWAVDLGIPDIIHKHGQPITLPELVSALEVPQSRATCVQRFMRLLAHIDLFAIVKKMDHEHEHEHEHEAYDLTPVSQLLVTDTDHCLSSMVRFEISPPIMSPYHELGKWTLNEDPSLFGGQWDFIHQNPTHLKIFNEAMESDSRVMRLALRDCKSVFESLHSLVDVGGGTGNTAKIICDAFPKLKYTVLDLPEVVTGLTNTNNLTFVGGNMFNSIPQAGAVLLKWVLHNWSDEDSIKILKNCKDAITENGKGGKVIIIDIVINEKEDELEMTELKLLFDVTMMTTLNGKERSEKEWKQIFVDAGFTNYKIFPMFGFRSLIELYP